MIIERGSDTIKHGPGITIQLTGDEVALAIDTFLVAQGVTVRGPRTVRVNGDLCKAGRVYVDPSGFVIDAEGYRWEGSLDFNESRKTFALWAEGYRCTGNEAPARFLGEFEAVSFEKAVDLYNVETEGTKIDKVKGTFRQWGCRVFDNEKDARKSFG